MIALFSVLRQPFFFSSPVLASPCPLLAGLAPGEQIAFELPYGDLATSPLYYVHLPNDEIARAVISRSLMTRVLLEEWGEGSTYPEMLAAVSAYPHELKAPYQGRDQSFRLDSDRLGNKLTPEEQVELYEQLGDPTGMLGPVDLKTPMHRFWLLMTTPKTKHLEGLGADLPTRYYFGREVAAGDRSAIAAYKLSNRRYLGTTSMESEMALLMARLGRVRRGSFVYDPFVGTGSVLVAAAHLGAVTVGADIDPRVVKIGKLDKKSGEQVNVWSNFEQYKLQKPVGLLRADAARPPWRNDLEEVFDAIVCDPPYGFRAGGRRGVSFSDLDRRSQAQGGTEERDEGGQPEGEQAARAVAEKAVASSSEEGTVNAPAEDAFADTPVNPSVDASADASVDAPISTSDPPSDAPSGRSRRPRLPIRDRQTHRPRTEAYPLADCLHDLLEMSAKTLRVGGRLVYFYPAVDGVYDERLLPGHPMLRRVANCEQALTSRYSRRLVVMDKVRPYDAELVRKSASEHECYEDPATYLAMSREEWRNIRQQRPPKRRAESPNEEA